VTESVYTQAQIAQDLSNCGIAAGDAVLIHSSFKSVGKVEGGPEGLIAALSECVGPDGTLIFPTFNFGFCGGEPFDVRSTPSHMGVLSETARLDPRSTRVAHPIYSFAVIGRRADEAGAICNVSCYGADSLFGKLVEWDGKIAIVGLPYNNSMTFFHHVEEMLGCGYRYMKAFEGTVVDAFGRSATRTVTMFVRNVDAGVVTAVDPMGAVLEREGVVTLSRVGGADVKVMRARDAFEATARHFSNEPGLLYRIDSAAA
jgi:aminoglycoside 3-N-acetyltransferase